MKERYFRTNEAAKIFEVNERTIRKWIEQKILPAEKKKNVWYIRNSEIIKLAATFRRLDFNKIINKL